LRSTSWGDPLGFICPWTPDLGALMSLRDPCVGRTKRPRFEDLTKVETKQLLRLPAVELGLVVRLSATPRASTSGAGQNVAYRDPDGFLRGPR
jgi:hypothetical protein